MQSFPPQARKIFRLMVETQREEGGEGGAPSLAAALLHPPPPIPATAGVALYLLEEPPQRIHYR